MGLELNEHSWPRPGGHGSIGEAPTVLAECPDYGQQIDIYTARTRPGKVNHREGSVVRGMAVLGRTATALPCHPICAGSIPIDRPFQTRFVTRPPEK